MLELLRHKFNTQKRKPIVFVPGLYGSMSDEIISGTGDWGFGMAASVYEPFIRSLEEMGYKKNEDLFIAFYDWRKECTFCARRYLRDVIDKAKKKCKSRKVNIICHSMGGLVARAYVQSKNYRYDVDHLIMIATPNGGAVNAYCFWAGGMLPYKRNIKSNIFRTLLEGYLWVLEKLYSAKNEMETIHKHLKSAKDLLPSHQYGDYLYYLNKDGNLCYVSCEKMAYQNDFLNQLNEREYLLKRRRVKVTLIGGKGVQTNNYLQIDKRYKDKENKWLDGKVIGISKSEEGDGTVMLRSVFAIEGDSYVFQATHVDILKKCRFVIGKKLGIKENNIYRKNDESLNNYISILVNGVGDLFIRSVTKEGIITIYDGIKSMDGVYVEKYDEGLKWIILVGISRDRLYMEYIPKENGKMEIQIDDSFGMRKKIQEREVRKNQAYRLNLS
ncbi:acetyltransferase [Crassaminicella thermophila]|uniref:Acetyltransferase n=2 Tax=Crassaminicella thermophila TaxID=2599308 RepID=A0A5C0SHY1_CRATE|nr:acetyltransferase [Crassaminicella thermophila]